MRYWFAIILAVILPVLDTARLTSGVIYLSLIWLVALMLFNLKIPVLITAAVLDFLTPQGFPWWMIAVGAATGCLFLINKKEFFIHVLLYRLTASGFLAGAALFAVLIISLSDYPNMPWILIIQRVAVSLAGGYAIYGFWYFFEKRKQTAYVVE